MGSNDKNENWASDEDANDLLTGILDETEEDARSEEEQIEAELEAKRAERRRREKEEEERQRAEAEARITAEKERLESLEKRRTMRQEALRREELAEQGELDEESDDHDGGVKTDPADPSQQDSQFREGQQVSRSVEQRQPVEPEDVTVERPGPVSEGSGSSRSGALLALAAVLALVIGAGLTAFVLAQDGYTPDQATYAKSVYEPKEPKNMQVSMGVTPLDRAEAGEKPEETASPTHQPETMPADDADDDDPGTTSGQPSTGGNSGSTKPTLPDLDDGDFDPFAQDP